MKPTCVISFSEVTPTSTIASHKIASFLADHLQVPLFDNEKTIHIAKRYERWLVVNLPFSFCKFQAKYIQIIKSMPHLEIVWVQNDYTIPIRTYKMYLTNPSHQVSTWSNMPYYVKSKRDAYINWNMLTYKPTPPRIHEKKGIVYWGAFRKDRIDSFEQFFQEGTYDLHISTASKKSAKKFFYLSSGKGRKKNSIHLYPPFKDVINNIKNFQATLYMEDQWSTRNYNSPANRFYEALSAGVPILFERKSQATFEQAGYDVSPYVVHSHAEVEYALENTYDIQQTQRQQWHEDYIDQLKHQINEANLL